MPLQPSQYVRANVAPGTVIGAGTDILATTPLTPDVPLLPTVGADHSVLYRIWITATAAADYALTMSADGSFDVNNTETLGIENVTAGILVSGGKYRYDIEGFKGDSINFRSNQELTIVKFRVQIISIGA